MSRKSSASTAGMRTVWRKRSSVFTPYASGMSQQNIAEQIKELYDVEISPELATKIAEKIMPEVTAWQNRPLEAVCPFIFMEAIHL